MQEKGQFTAVGAGEWGSTVRVVQPLAPDYFGAASELEMSR